MKSVYLLIYTVAVQFFSVGGICLTWNVTTDFVFFKCQVFSYVRLESEIKLMDSNDKIRVKCSINGSPYCVAKEEGDIVFEETSKKEFELVLQTKKKIIKGDWKCYHGSKNANIHVDISKGIVNSLPDIHLSGDVRVDSKMLLTCYSCWVPDTKSAYFFVNNVLEDVVRMYEGKCYRKRKACSQTECTCSTEGNYFTWNFTSDLPYVEFSCEMRFKHEETSQLSIHTANIYYNETEFQHKIKTIRNIPVSDREIYIDDGTTNANYSYLGIVTLITTVSMNLIIIGIGFGCKLLYKMFGLGNIFGVKTKRQEPQTKDLLLACATCNAIVTCALCVDCREHYCDACCLHHREMNDDHVMCLTQQIAVNQSKVNCYITKCTKTAEQLCINCWKPFCTLCSRKCHCKNKKNIHIYQEYSVPKRHKSGEVQNKLIPLYNVSFQDDNNPVRVCGMAFLVDETVVVIDGNNDKLIVIKSKEEQRLANNELFNKPNAITAITGNEFAVTYPYQRNIQLYKLTYDTIQSNYRVSSLKTIHTRGKPFSIAYYQGIFAVEIGEREDGTIGIIYLNDTTVIKTVKCDYAYFTGHTIRLALDQNRVFVSAMGTKMIFCMDFNGKKLWHQSVPGPRAMIVLEDYSSSKKILLASKRCNAIYELKEEGQHHKILKVTDKISTPRYMAYHSGTKHLCVLVGNDKSHKDELSFLEYKDDEPNESTSPVGETELQMLMNMPVNEIFDGP